MTRTLILPAFAAALLAGAAYAASHGPGGHGGHAMHGASPSTEAYMEANAAMHAGMDIEFTGDADVDFARGMIPHHQGAIDMARVVLEHGADPELRKLAEEIIAAQESEIAFLKAWLEKAGR